MLKRSKAEHLRMAAKWEQRAAKEPQADKKHRLKGFALCHRLLVKHDNGKFAFQRRKPSTRDEPGDGGVSMTTTLDKLLAEKQALLERLQQEDIGPAERASKC